MEASLAIDRITGATQAEIERVLVRLPADPDATFVALERGAVAGYAAPRFDDLTIHPVRRGRGHGTRLLAAARDDAIQRGDRLLLFHVPPHLPASIAFAESRGLRYHSSLWQFELSAAVGVTAPAFAGDLVTRAWADDEDLASWVTFHDAIFADHPTPLPITVDLLRRVHSQAAFDPGSILVVARRDEPVRRLGFARVEVMAGTGDPPRGLVNLLGVVPEWRGRGLGRELLRWAVTRLRDRGAGQIELRVEGTNERATKLYRDHGFAPITEWPHWAVPLDGRAA